MNKKNMTDSRTDKTIRLFVSSDENACYMPIQDFSVGIGINIPYK